MWDIVILRAAKVLRRGLATGAFYRGPAHGAVGAMRAGSPQRVAANLVSRMRIAYHARPSEADPCAVFAARAVDSLRGGNVKQGLGCAIRKS